MGLCASSEQPARSADHLRFPPASCGSHKFGPYVPYSSSSSSSSSAAAASGLRYFGTGPPPEGLPQSFDSAKACRDWLLAHVTIEKRSGEHVTRPPGTLRGAQCIISDCDDCDIFLFDHTATVSVDRCTNCRIIVGPCDASVFLRDCSKCTMAVAARQVRTRGCTDLTVRLFCGTAPVIEKSKRIGLACWRGGWFEFERQLETCALSPFQNRWAQVHDFTPPSGGGHNWFVLEPGPETEAQFKSFEPHLFGVGGDDAVPQTMWRTATSQDDLLLFDATEQGYRHGAAAARQLGKKGLLVDCKHQWMTPEAWDLLKKAAHNPAAMTAALRKDCVFQQPTAGSSQRKPPFPQVIVLRVNSASPKEPDLGHRAECIGAAGWFDGWDLAV